jgi:hypothetical protein
MDLDTSYILAGGETTQELLGPRDVLVSAVRLASGPFGGIHHSSARLPPLAPDLVYTRLYS